MEETLAIAAVPESVEEDEAGDGDPDQEMEYFLSLAKPDAVAHGLVGVIIDRFEKRGLQLCYLQWLVFSEDQVRDFYLDKQDVSFWDDLKAFMMSGPVVAMVWSGLDANNRGRQIVGDKSPVESAPGSLRGSLPALNKIVNLVHGSRSEVEALAEMQIVCPMFLAGTGAGSAARDRPAEDSPYAPQELAAPGPETLWEGSFDIVKAPVEMPWTDSEEIDSRW